MNNNVKFFHSLIFAITCFVLLFSSFSCTYNEGEIFVTWVDSDGVLIDSKAVTGNYDPTERKLPDDNNLWHYTGWTITQSGSVIVCTANRIEKKHVVWKDYNGGTLSEVYVAKNESLPSFDLPKSNDKWIYESWDRNDEDNQIVFTAVRKPNVNFFVGNVFQIVVKDENGDPIGSGSGFVINDEGWFITNDHVMKDGYSAISFFDIIDSENGQKYTQLKIIGRVYHDENRDIFIGKLEGYDKIKDHYSPIEFTEKYTIGEKSYSVGYPNSSIKLEINSGNITEEYSDIYNKIDGIYYVLSDSYIAPGSSGGILINESFEVVGITTTGFYSDSNKNNYISGGSVPYLLFKRNLSNLSEENIKSIPEIYKK